MPPDYRHPEFILLLAGLTVLACLAVCTAAILTPAPPAAVPIVALMCVGSPMFASWQVPGALASLRARRGRKALAMLRRSLDRLPEVEHPLGL